MTPKHLLFSQADVSVVTLFCTQEDGLLLHDYYLKPLGLQALLALDVPYYYYSCKVRTEIDLLRSFLCWHVCWDFVDAHHCFLCEIVCLAQHTLAVISERWCLSTGCKSFPWKNVQKSFNVASQLPAPSTVYTLWCIYLKKETLKMITNASMLCLDLSVSHVYSCVGG